LTNQPESNGRPKGSISLKTHLRNILDTKLKNGPDPLQDGSPRDMTAGEKAMLNLAVKAVADGDAYPINKIVEMLEGKPFQAMSVEGGDPANPLVTKSDMTAVPDALVSRIAKAIKESA
jgi:hypothetical protein